MNEQSGNPQKYLINCQDGSNNPERATISMILAFTASKTCETAMFVSAEASQICVKGGADSINAEGYESLRSLLDGYIETAANCGFVLPVPKPRE